MHLGIVVNIVHYVSYSHCGVLVAIPSMRLSMAKAAQNIETMRQAFAALNRRDIEACTSLMTEDFIIHIAEMPHQSAVARRGAGMRRSCLMPFQTRRSRFRMSSQPLTSSPCA